MAVVPDTLGRVVEYLRAELAAEHPGLVVVGGDAPSPLPATLVKVTRVGGPTPHRALDLPILLVEAWAGTKSGAWELVRDARALLTRTGRHITGLYVHRWEEVGGPADDPDPDTELARWRFSVQLHVRVRGV